MEGFKIYDLSLFINYIDGLMIYEFIQVINDHSID